MEVFRIFGSIFLQGADAVKTQLQGIDKTAQTTATAMGKTGTSAEALGGRMMDLGNALMASGAKMTALVTTPLALLGSKLVGTAAAAEETQNLFTVSMGIMADSAGRWSASLAESFGLNETNVKRNVATFNVMFDSMGMGTAASYDMATSLTQLAYDLASFYDLRPDEAFEKLRSGMVGMSRPLQDIGIIVKENTIQTYAYTHGIAEQGAELTEEQKVLARFGVIMEATQKAQGDWLRTNESLTIQMKSLKERTSAVAEEFGKALYPIALKLIEWARSFVDWLDKLDDGTKRFIVTVGALAALLGPIKLVLGAIVSAIGTLIFYLPTLSAGFTVLNAALGPIGWAITGIITVIGLWVAAQRRAEADIKASAEAIAAKMRETYESEWQAFQTAKLNELREAENQHTITLGQIEEEYRVRKERLGDETAALREELDNRRTMLDEEHQKTIDQIEEEYDLIFAGLDEEEQQLVDHLQGKIDVIDEQEREFERNERAARLEKRRAEIEEQLHTETDILKRKQLKEDLAEAEMEIAKNAMKVNNENEREALRDAIKLIRGNIADRRAEYEADKKNKLEEENNKYKAAVKEITDELDELEKALPKRQKILDEELKQKQQTETDKLKATQDRVRDELAEEEKLHKQRMEDARLEKEAWDEAKKAADAARRASEAASKAWNEYYTGGGGAEGEPGVPKEAGGGTAVSGGWALVGERGPELLYQPRGASVVPLDKGMGTANIIVELDGRTIAKAIGQPLVDEIRLRTGLVSV